MKRVYNIIGIVLLVLCGLTACNNDDNVVVPENIGNLKAEPREGSVMLKWSVPADSSYLYVRLMYQHPVTGEGFIKNVSIYADSILVDGLLAKDGEYTFTLQTVSETNDVNSTMNTIQSRALPVQPTVQKMTEKIELTVDNVSTNAQEPTEGPIAALIDGNLTNFFHTAWSVSIPEPHWIDIVLPTPLDTFEFLTWYRGGKAGGSSPSVITLLGSNDNATWEAIETVNDDHSLPKDKPFVSPVITSDKPYKYIRYRCDKNPDNNVYFHLAEMQINKVWYDIYDPEGIYKPEE